MKRNKTTTLVVLVFMLVLSTLNVFAQGSTEEQANQMIRNIFLETIKNKESQFVSGMGVIKTLDRLSKYSDQYKLKFPIKDLLKVKENNAINQSILFVDKDTEVKSNEIARLWDDKLNNERFMLVMGELLGRIPSKLEEPRNKIVNIVNKEIRLKDIYNTGIESNYMYVFKPETISVTPSRDDKEVVQVFEIPTKGETVLYGVSMSNQTLTNIEDVLTRWDYYKSNVKANQELIGTNLMQGLFTNDLTNKLKGINNNLPLSKTLLNKKGEEAILEGVTQYSRLQVTSDYGEDDVLKDNNVTFIRTSLLVEEDKETGFITFIYLNNKYMD